MDADRIKNYLIIYISLIMPILFMILVVITEANLLWHLLFLGWLCAGLLIVFLPTHPESSNG